MAYSPSCIFITGATSGIGRACAVRFSATLPSAKLILAGRRTQHLLQLKNDLKANPVHIITLDVRDKSAVKQALDNLPASFQNIDVLVNNAGLARGLEPAHEAKLSDWDEMVDTNVKGLLYCTRYVLAGMVRRGKGHVINMGSAAGSYPYPGGNTYGATKAFVENFSLNLRADLAGKNIRVTNIEPGLTTGSEFSNVRFHGDDTRATKVYDGANAITSDDVAEAVVWSACLPPNVNINRIEMMPTSQSFAGFTITRTAAPKSKL